MTLVTSFRAARISRWLRACEAVGAAPELDARPWIEAEGHVRIGDRFRLRSRPVESHLVAGPDATLEIGDDVSIGHGAGISAFEHVQIGDGTSIGPYVLIMDTNFHGSTGDQSVQHDTRPITIGKSCRIGSRVTIMRGASIGDGCEILAGSVVLSSIPPGRCAGGARARVLGRAGDPACRWDGPAVVLPELVKEAFGLDAVPDLHFPLSALAADRFRLAQLVDAIERQFGTTIDAAAFRGDACLSDAVAALSVRVDARSRTVSPGR